MIPDALKFLWKFPEYCSGAWHIIADYPKPEKYGSIYSYSSSANSGIRLFIGIVIKAAYAAQEPRSF